MKDRDEVIRQGLAALAEEPPRLTEEFLALLLEVAAAGCGQARRAGLTAQETAEEAAEDFALALVAEGASHGTIATWAALKRAYRRWLTARQNPQGRELWSVVSKALRDLEREGVVERPPSQRDVHVGNLTEWYLRGSAAQRGAIPDERAVANAMPGLGARGEGDRILKPAEARQAVLAILRLAAGRLTMIEIVDSLRPHVPMLSVKSAADCAGGPEDAEADPLEQTAATQAGPDTDLIVETEVEHRSKSIWHEAGQIARGKGDAVTGRRVLCCYWIPARVGKRKITLEQFGPTSTVHDVVTDLEAILRRHLPVPAQERGDPSWELTCRRIAEGILAQLARLCSENDLCRDFYGNWSQ